MREITLSGGAVTVVDDEDFAFLSRWKWKLHPQGYAARSSWRDGRYYTVLLHRLVAQTPDGLETDHRNGDKLDNRRANLRAVTHAVNERNKPLSRRNTSGVKGVTWDKNRQKWMAKTKHEGRHVNLGRFDTLDEAAAAFAAFVATLS